MRQSLCVAAHQFCATARVLAAKFFFFSARPRHTLACSQVLEGAF